MRNKTKLTIVAVTIFLVLSVTVAVGAHFEGDGSGSVYTGIQTIYPFQPWEGTLNTSTGVFLGWWDDDFDNWIYGETVGSEGVYCLGYTPGNTGDWAYNDNEMGTWGGCFDVNEDTAQGGWSANSPFSGSGYFWGTRTGP